MEYFRGLVDAFCYFECKEKGDYPSIDRVEAHKGYVAGNLRVVEFSKNVSKGNRERHLPEHVQSMLERKRKAKQDLLAAQQYKLTGNPADLPEDHPDYVPF